MFFFSLKANNVQIAHVLKTYCSLLNDQSCVINVKVSAYCSVHATMTLRHWGHNKAHREVSIVRSQKDTSDFFLLLPFTLWCLILPLNA